MSSLDGSQKTHNISTTQPMYYPGASPSPNSQVRNYVVSTPTKQDGVKPTPPHVGMAEEAKQKVHLMHAEMQMVEATIESLQMTNAQLKRKLLNDRKCTLEKYFMSNDHLIKQAVVGEWKELMYMIHKKRAQDEAEGLRHKEKLRFEQSLGRLNAENQKLREEAASARKEIMELKSKVDQAESLIRGVSEQMGRYPVSPAKTTIVPNDAGEYVKQKLHDILRDVDPRYIPPLNGPTIHEIAREEQIAYAQGRVMHPRPNVAISSANGTMSNGTISNQLPASIRTFPMNSNPSNNTTTTTNMSNNMSNMSKSGSFGTNTIQKVYDTHTTNTVGKQGTNISPLQKPTVLTSTTSAAPQITTGRLNN